MTNYIEDFVYVTLVLYLLAAGCYFLGNKNKSIARTGLLIAIAGIATNLMALISRALLVSRLPITNGAEFILSFSGFTVIAYAFYELKSRNNNAGGVVLMIAAMLVGSIVTLMPEQLGDVKPLMPALKSPWLTSHVLTAIFSYGGFALAAGLAAIQLWRANSSKGEEWIYKIVAVSFVMLTVTIVLGAIWAEQAWGRYWSWDPKETWALVTWIIYAVYLHLYRQKSWKGQKSNMLVVGGFILVLFTYFGVNFLLSGLHSYGG
ncbi:MAG: cytochrome c biogenesis protein CcsA [Peptococcaceae bacterium]|nr:cytochrome c biogenesis protein CcsA [Peptococcaceae bacterium]